MPKWTAEAPDIDAHRWPIAPAKCNISAPMKKDAKSLAPEISAPGAAVFFLGRGQGSRAVPDADHDRHHLRQCLCCENIPCDVNNKCGQVHRLKLDRARRGLNFITLGVNFGDCSAADAVAY